MHATPNMVAREIILYWLIDPINCDICIVQFNVITDPKITRLAYFINS